MSASFNFTIMTTIVSLTKRVAELDDAEKAACFALLSSQFLGIRRADFERDLAEKDAVLFLRCDDAVVGFSTIMTLPLVVNARRVTAIFSGDTAVDPRFRTSSGPLRELGRYFLDTLRDAEEDVFYILISKGWRTYKLMASLFEEFWPSGRAEARPTFDDVGRASARQVIDAFGATKYPQSFDATSGIIRGNADAPRVRPDGVDSAPPAKPDAHTAFFLRANPHYLAGDELVCAGHVTPGNFAAPLRRVLGRTHSDDARFAAVGAALLG